MLEKALESPLDCKEIQPVHSKGDPSWVFFGRNDDEAETPVLWLPIQVEDSYHEIKRHSLFGRKVMTNLDSILKSRDITLPTKVHLVKAMVLSCTDVRVGP